MWRQRPVVERLLRNLGERRLRDVEVVHVALELRAEELGRHHEAVLAVPRRQRPVGRVVLEGAAGVLVETDDEADVVRAGLERADGRDERRAAGRASVLHVHERQARRAEVGHHRVGVPGVLAAAVRELHVGPHEPGIGERVARSMDAHREAADALVPAEGVDAGTDDRDAGHSTAANA
jgi:hypothetical protein